MESAVGSMTETETFLSGEMNLMNPLNSNHVGNSSDVSPCNKPVLKTSSSNMNTDSDQYSNVAENGHGLENGDVSCGEEQRREAVDEDCAVARLSEGQTVGKENMEKEGERKDGVRNEKENDRGEQHGTEHKELHKEKHKDRHKDKHKDKHHEEHRGKHKEGEKERHKNRDAHKEERKEKHADGHKEKHKSKDGKNKKDSSKEVEVKKEKHRHKDSSHSKDVSGVKIKDEPGDVEIKDEPGDVEIKDEPDDDGYTNTYASPKKRKVPDEVKEEEDEPLVKKKIKTEKESSKKKKIKEEPKEEPEDDYDDEPLVKKSKHKHKTEVKTEVKQETPSASPSKKKKKEEESTVWKWWEEEKRDEGIKWKFLEHQGPLLAEPYVPLPREIYMSYNGHKCRLQPAAEEVATFYAKMLDHDYTSKEAFNHNFFRDWCKTMTAEERAKITDLKKCDFRRMHEHFTKLSEERKNRTKEEKQELKEKNAKLQEKYGFCMVDGYKQKIANFRIEPPGLFRGRGDHPKMGKLKKRVRPEDVIINCSRDAKVPPPPEGHKWKEIRHDNSVTWLATWTENVQGQNKYVMLNASSKLKGEKDWQKYEMARKLKKHVVGIREQYQSDLKSKEMRVRQRAVALYFIDKLALRAGNEKDEKEAADTVGCCSLRCEHITLHEKLDGKENVVQFDFLGKDSIRYFNQVPVEKRVFKNLGLFMEHKKGSDDLFDRLNTSILNKYLTDLMDGLTAKVFRTYNASFTLQDQLDKLTNPDDSIPAKILSYNRANRAVAVLCNHQRAVPKTFEKSMANLQDKIKEKLDVVKAAKKEYKAAKNDYKATKSDRDRAVAERKKKALQRVEEQLTKLELQATDRDENKTIALGTSKLNYLDPRISVAWCKKYDVPIEKVYNKTQREKFQWAIDMAGPDYHF